MLATIKTGFLPVDSAYVCVCVVSFLRAPIRGLL